MTYCMQVWQTIHLIFFALCVVHFVVLFLLVFHFLHAIQPKHIYTQTFRYRTDAVWFVNDNKHLINYKIHYHVQCSIFLYLIRIRFRWIRLWRLQRKCVQSQNHNINQQTNMTSCWLSSMKYSNIMKTLVIAQANHIHSFLWYIHLFCQFSLEHRLDMCLVFGVCVCNYEIG